MKNTPTSELFAALGDPVRLQIIEQLSRSAEMPAGEIAKAHRISAPAISRHLKVLETAELVQSRPQHRWRYYRLNPNRFEEARDWFEYHLAFWEASLNQLDRMIKRQDKEIDKNE